MPRGAKPGQRFGGRKPGTPNKATIEKAIIAERIVNEAEMKGRKLGKEVLEEFMVMFAGIAAAHQPGEATREAIKAWSNTKDQVTFERYASLATTTAKELAKYQSPQLRAVMVAPAPQPNQGAKKTKFTFDIFAEVPKTIDAKPASRSQH